MRAASRLLAIAAVAAALTACDKAPAAPDAVLDGWKKAGLQVSAFTAAQGAGLGGGTCQSGTVNVVDVTLCHYADEKAAKAAEEAGLATVGDATGVSIAQGKMLLVVADRRKADPSGKTIDQVTKVFRGRQK